MDPLKHKWLFVIVWSFIYCNGILSQSPTTATPVRNTTEDDGACKLVPELLEIREEIAKLANNGDYKLIKLNVRVHGAHNDSKDLYSSTVYQPRHWVIATSATGKSMLMLREYFEPMSLYTLGFGVASRNIILDQRPPNCLDKFGISDIETLLRKSILSNFGSESVLPQAAEVCNQHIESREGSVASLVYICCKNDLTLPGTVNCKLNAETVWIKTLFVSLYIIQAFVVAYCPLFLPDTLFRAKTLFEKYVFKTEPGKSLVFNVKRVDDGTPISEAFVKARCQNFTDMKVFGNTLTDMKMGQVYTMHVDGVDLSVGDSNIIADGSAPVGFLSFLYHFFIQCSLRSEIPAVSPCCNADMCKSITHRHHFRWYQCLRIIMLFVLFGILALPWIFRVWFYYEHEEDVITYKKGLYKSLNLTMPFNGFVVTYLSPLHPVFIAIYSLLALEAIIYIPQSDTVKRKLKFTIRKCFWDMRESSKMDVFGYLVSKMLYPLTRFGIVGCLVAPLWIFFLPFLLLMLALEALPIVNLTIRLLANLIYYTLRMISPKIFSFVRRHKDYRWQRGINNRLDAILVTDFQEENTRLNQFIHAMSLILSLVSIWCVMFLIADCVAFYIECIVYILIGFILNTKDTLKYISLTLLIVVYVIECFSGVRERYVAYGTALNAKVQELVGDRIKEVAAKSAKEQVNTAFRIEGDSDQEQMYIVAGTERYLKWRAPRLVLFLSSVDIPMIPTSFLMRMSKLPHVICPGRVHILYLKALIDFSLIVLFLLFVFIVIFAFGQAQDISSGGQAVAALGSGFLPLILKKFFFQSQSGPSIDTSNLKWNCLFKDALDKYRERWHIEDIYVSHVEEAKVPSEVERGNTNTTEVNETSGENDVHVVGTDNDIKLLPKYQEGKVDVDLIVKIVKNADFEMDVEFYVPITRAVEYEDDEIITDDTGSIEETLI